MSSGKSERVKKLEKQVREMQESLAKKEAQIVSAPVTGTYSRAMIVISHSFLQQQALDTKSEKELFLESQIKEVCDPTLLHFTHFN